MPSKYEKEVACQQRTDCIRRFGSVILIASSILFFVNISIHNWYEYDDGHNLGLWEICDLKQTNETTNSTSSTTTAASTTTEKTENNPCKFFNIGSVGGGMHAARIFAVMSCVVLGLGIVIHCHIWCDKPADSNKYFHGCMFSLVSAFLHIWAPVIFHSTEIWKEYSYGSSGHYGFCYYSAYISPAIMVLGLMIHANHDIYKKIKKKNNSSACPVAEPIPSGPFYDEGTFELNVSQRSSTANTIASRTTATSLRSNNRVTPISPNHVTGNRRSSSHSNIFTININNANAGYPANNTRPLPSTNFDQTANATTSATAPGNRFSVASNAQNIRTNNVNTFITNSRPECRDSGFVIDYDNMALTRDPVIISQPIANHNRTGGLPLAALPTYEQAQQYSSNGRINSPPPSYDQIIRLDNNTSTCL